MKFNEKVSILRRKKGWSQEDLANEVEVSRQSVYKWESGENVPDIEKIKKLAKIFNVSLDSLLIDENELDYEPSNVVMEDKSFITTTELESFEVVDTDNSDVEDNNQVSTEFFTSESTNSKCFAKNKLLFIVEIVKLVINCITIPLLFIPFFHEVAVLPGVSVSGEHITSRFDHYYSIYDKVAREGLSVWFWIAVLTIAISILICVFNMVIKNSKTLKITGYVICGISIVLFFVLLFIACAISYSY